MRAPRPCSPTPRPAPPEGPPAAEHHGRRAPARPVAALEAVHRYADLFERAPVGYMVLDGEGRVLEANATLLLQLGGASRDMVIGWPFELYVVPAHRLRFLNHLAMVVHAQTPSACHVHLASPRGPALFVACLESLAVIEHPGRRVVRTIVADATERFRDEALFVEIQSFEREAREQAAAEQERLQKLAAASAELSESLDLEAATARAAELATFHVCWYCAIDLVTEDGGVRRAAFARRDGEPLDLPLDPYAPRGPAAVARDGAPLLLPDVGYTHLFGLAQSPDAVRALYERVGGYLCIPLRAHGRTLGAMTFVQPRGEPFSASEIVLAEEVARHAALAIDNARLYREAQEADRRKDEFLAMLGHELRNPLAAVVTAAKTLQMREGEGAASQRTADVVARQSERLVRIVDDLLDVSRITRGKIQLQRRRVELCDVVERAVESIRPLMQQKHHALLVDMRDRPTHVDADPARIEQVVVNLLANAAKYTPPGGRIELEAGAVGDEAVVRVRDNGVGIPRDKLALIFAPFVQLDATPDRTDRGLGIGLALAKNLAELHGGRVTARSDGPGHGSEFDLRLPRAEPAEEAPAEALPPPSPGPASHRRVLVVEDNPDVAMMLKEELELLGQEVRTADDGPEAIAAALAFRPQLMLIDIGLPGMTGFDVARRLRREHALDGAKLVALTGYGGAETTEECLAAGFDRHFTKPISEDALMGLLCVS